MFHTWMDEWREKEGKARQEKGKSEGWIDELYSR